MECVKKNREKTKNKIMGHWQKVLGRVAAKAPHTELKPPLLNISFRVHSFEP
jgi:hypothetical protein